MPIFVIRCLKVSMVRKALGVDLNLLIEQKFLFITEYVNNVQTRMLHF